MVDDNRATVDRRTVLKSSAGVAGAASVAGFLEDVEDLGDGEGAAGGDEFEWDSTHDLLVVGSGGAGESAAIAAASDGADVVVLERLDTFGGDTRHSSGITHFGGGTAWQEEHGVEETPGEYYDYLSARIGELGSDEHIRRYAANSADHFDWVLDQDVPIEDELQVSGAERVWPYREITDPKPHNHQIDPDGSAYWENLHESAVEAGAEHVSGVEVQNLVREGGRIAGVALERNGSREYYRGEDGVILATGGFEANEEMMERHLPNHLENPSLSQGMHQGHGIQMGVAAGADSMNMSESWSAIYFQPDEMKQGILVNPQGRRTITEDHYGGSIGTGVLNRPYHDVGYFIVDDETARSALDDVSEWDNIGYADYEYLGGADSVDEIAEVSGIDGPTLRSTVDLYNERASAGEDPVFGKNEEYLKELEAPYHVYEIPGDAAIYITWGGLTIDTETRVLDPFGEPIEGLYSAGRNATGNAFATDGYDSGMSLADITFWGRVSGKIAYQGEDAHPYTESLDVPDEPEESEEAEGSEDGPPHVREVEEWLDDDDTYDEIHDRTDEAEVSVVVGAEGNNGSNAFDPSAIEVSPGTTVVWEWSGEGIHNVVAEDGSFESELTDDEEMIFERTFEEDGVHRYYCTPHVDYGMLGAVVVSAVE